MTHINRSFERPRGYTSPTPSWLTRIWQLSGPVVLGGTVVAGWIFGLFVLFKTRTWDALTNRVPLAICATALLQTGLGNIDGSGLWQSLLGVAALAVLLAGTVLPALSGVILWLRRRSPARVWAADRLTRGRVLEPAVAASLVAGVSGGAAIAAASVLTDLAALNITGFVPSISRELEIVDAAVLSSIGSALGAASFLAVGIGLAVEALQRLRLHPAHVLAIVSLASGLVAAANQQSILPALPLVAGLSAGAAVVAALYQRRGLLAATIACLVAGLLITAMAARSLDDPDLLRHSNSIVTLITLLFALGVCGLVMRYRATRQRA